MDSVIRPSNNRGLEVIADIDVSFQHPAQLLIEGVSAIHLSKLPHGALKNISSLHTFTRGCSGKRTGHERKTSEPSHIRRQSVCHRENRSRLVSPSRHVSVRNGETLGTMLGAVV